MGYKTITLYSVEADCSTITFEKFFDLIKSSFSKAVDEATRIGKDLKIKRYETLIKEYAERRKTQKEKYLSEMRKFAEKKWKTEKYQQKFINEKSLEYDLETKERLKKYENDKVWDDRYDNISYFDFDVYPGVNGINNYCILDKEKIDNKNVMQHCFDILKKSNFFNNAKGWSYETCISDTDYREAFRAQIKLILSPETNTEFEGEKRKLSEDIKRFYADCKYFGD